MKLKTFRDELINEKELVSTINNARNDEIKAIIAFLYKTGARISEVRAVKKKDFVINENEGFWAVQIPTLKQRKKFTRPFRILKNVIDGLFVKVILPYINKFNNPESLVFPHSSVYYWKCIKKANPNLYPHFFRHNLACALSEDVDTIAMQQWFGWVGLDMPVVYTRKRYAIESVFEKMKSKYEKRKANILSETDVGKFITKDSNKSTQNNVLEAQKQDENSLPKKNLNN